MANDTLAVNVSQNHDNVDGDKPALTAKEPTPTKPMLYESNPIMKANGLSNGTRNHTSSSTTQRKEMHSFRHFNDITDPKNNAQALNPIRALPRTGVNPISRSQRTNRSRFFMRLLSQLNESCLPSSITSMIPTFMTLPLKAFFNPSSVRGSLTCHIEGRSGTKSSSGTCFQSPDILY